MSGIILSSALAGAAVALLASDVIPLAKSWNTASALVPRREAFIPAAVVKFVERVRGLSRRGDGTQWEEICYSLAFHLRAGETPAQAIKGAAGEGESHAHSVLRRVTQVYDAGSALQAALSQTSESQELRQIASALEMGSASGGNIPMLLCHTAEALRRRRLDRGELRSKLAEARATALLLSFLPWGIGAFTLSQDPQAATVVFNDPKGRVLLAVAAALWAIGNAAVVLILRTLLPRRPAGRPNEEVRRQ